MPIRDLDGQKYVSFSEGIDDTTVVDSPELVGTLSKALNTDLVDDSLLKKRGGYVPVNTTAFGTRKIRQGFDYKAANGTQQTLVYAQDSAATGSSGVFAKIVGNSISSILTGRLDDVKPTILQFRSLVFVFPGQGSFLYDGSATRQIGITPPVGAPGFISLMAGSLSAGLTYSYVYTFYNTATGAESSPSPPFSVAIGTDPSTNQGVKIGLETANSTLADRIRIYRTVGGGNIFFLEDEIVGTSTTFNSAINDASLGVELEQDNDRLPEHPKFAIVNDNRIFTGGFPLNPNRAMYTKIGINGPMPESNQATDFVDCNINDGDKLIGFGKANTTTIALKERSVGRFIRIEALTGGIERGGSSKYLYEELSNEITGLSHHLIVTLDNWVIWLGRDDIYATDGSQIVRIGRRIRKTIKSLNFDKKHLFSVVNKTDTQQIIFSVCRSGQAEPDFQIVGHYRNFPKIAWTFYGPGTNTSTHPGLKAASLFQVTEGTSRRVYFGSSAADGTVYKMDQGDADNGNGIYWEVALPWDANRNPAAKKMFHSYYVFAACGGPSPDNTLFFTWEENTNESVIKSETQTIPGTITTWSGGNWGSFNWSSSVFNPMRFYPRLKAYFGRFGWRNTAANEPIAIKGTTRIVQPVPIHR